MSIPFEHGEWILLTQPGEGMNDEPPRWSEFYTSAAMLVCLSFALDSLGAFHSLLTRFTDPRTNVELPNL
jgi:hypothetical protein